MVELAKQSDREDMWVSALEIAMPLYTRVLHSDLEVCVLDVAESKDLSKSVEGKSAKWVKFAANAARKAGKIADDALMSEPEEMIKIPFEGLDDFSLATLANVLFDRNPGCKNQDLSERMRARNIDAMHRILYSDECHPLVDYEWMATDFIDYFLATEEMDELDILKRCLAHTMRYNKKANIIPVLRQLGGFLIESGEINEGCRVYGELISSDPLDFENYHRVALELHNMKHYDLAIKVADRASHMLRITKTEDDMSGHLSICVDGDRRHLHDEDAKLDKKAEKPLRKAIETGFMRGTHLHIEDLAFRIVPELDCIPIKQVPSF